MRGKRLKLLKQLRAAKDAREVMEGALEKPGSKLTMQARMEIADTIRMTREFENHCVSDLRALRK